MFVELLRCSLRIGAVLNRKVEHFEREKKKEKEERKRIFCDVFMTFEEIYSDFIQTRLKVMLDGITVCLRGFFLVVCFSSLPLSQTSLPMGKLMHLLH